MNPLIVPHVGETHLPAVLGALGDTEKHNWHVHVTPLDGSDVTAYWQLVRNWWTNCAKTGQALMIVEHDVIVRPDVFAAFNDCPEPICAFTYWIGASYRYGLGCVRFRAEKITGRPSALDEVGRIDSDGLPIRRHWKRLDTRMWDVLGAPHVHEPPVLHLHDYPMKEPGR